MKNVLLCSFLLVILLNSFSSSISAKKNREPTSTPKPTITQKPVVISPTIVVPVETLIPDEPPLPTETPTPFPSPKPSKPQQKELPGVSFAEIVGGIVLLGLLYMLSKKVRKS